MKQPILAVIEIAKIDTDHGFRYTLNGERVTQLAAMRESGIVFDPIKVVKLKNGRFGIIAGNHRRQVALQRGETIIKALVYESMDILDTVHLGLEDNAGKDGSNPLPPTEADLRMMVRRLLRAECTHKQIKEAIPYPPTYVAQLIVSVRASEGKVNKGNALIQLAKEGCSVKKAAEDNKLTLKQLTSHLARKGKEASKNDLNFDVKNPHKSENAKIGLKVRTLSRTLSDTLNQALKDVDENGRPVKTVIKVLDHAEELIQNVMLSIQNVRARVAKLS